MTPYFERNISDHIVKRASRRWNLRYGMRAAFTLVVSAYSVSGAV
ncbi:hypothetical protein [Jiangella aurantiaca]|nr:hypothetical protein [Jiangella aurantiaca]